MGVGLAIGLALGVAVGAALDNLGMGIALGLALGIVFGSAGSVSKRREAEENGPDEPADGDEDPEPR